MATRYRYSILIKFHPENPNLRQGIVTVPYYRGAGATDEFKIHKKNIRINAYRDKKYPDSSDALFLQKNALSMQIRKAIEYYYITCPFIPKISSIDIARYTAIKKNKFTYKNVKGYSQPIVYKKGRTNSFFAESNISPMLNEDEKGNCYRVIVSYFLAAQKEVSSFSLFADAWKAINALYRYSSGSIKDYIGLQQLETLVYLHYSSLFNVRSLMPLHGSNKLKQFRWGDCLLSKIKMDKDNPRSATEDGLQTLRMITHYTDYRIIMLFLHYFTHSGSVKTGLYSLRNNQNLQMTSHFNHYNGSTGPIVHKDEEILSLIITKYAYFIRCNFFHGVEESDSFSLGVTPIHKELYYLSQIIFALIKDLINNHLI